MNQKRSRTMPSNNGFTLIEIMIVLAIIVLLALVLLPKSSIFKSSAKEAGLALDMSYIQGHLIIQIDKYGINNRFPNTTYPNYNTNFLAGKLENILERNSILENNDYHNFDGYQNPLSGNETILATANKVNTYPVPLHQPAVYITRNPFYKYTQTKVFAEAEKVNGTIVAYMVNGQENVELYYVDHKGKPSNYLIVSP